MRVVRGVRRARALAMVTSDARAQSGAPMEMSALRQLYPPFPAAATLADQSDEYGDVAAELGPEGLRFERPNAAGRGSWSKLFRIAAALMALSPPTAVFAQHASDDPLATANDAFGLTLGLESIGLYNPGGVRGFNPQSAGNVRIDGLYFDQQGALSNRVVEGSTIRIGASEIGYAFPAPTGIVDYDLRHPGTGTPSATMVASAGPFQAKGLSVDGNLPLISSELKLPIGASLQPYFNFDTNNVDHQLGVQRARGVELSLSGEVVPNLHVAVGALLGEVTIIGSNLAAAGVGTTAFGQPHNQGSINANYKCPLLPALSADITFLEFGSAPASVDDVLQSHTETWLSVGGRYRFKLWGASATLRVQVQNATNFYFWNMGYSPGFSQLQPRAYFAYLAADM
jgi:hypothetical protein